MPETITRPSPIIVKAIRKDGHPKYRHLWMKLAKLVDTGGNFVRWQWGKIYEGQQFEYVDDPAGLESDPHLQVISDPDGLVPSAIKAKYAAIRAAVAEQKRLDALKRGEDLDAPAAPPQPATAAPNRVGRPPRTEPAPSATSS